MMNPVDRYAYLLSGLSCSEDAKRKIVRKIREVDSEEEALTFFEKASHPLSIIRWTFYDKPSQRKAIDDIQNYLGEIGMEIPAPNRLVQRFLDGGKYPVKKK